MPRKQSTEKEFVVSAGSSAAAAHRKPAATTRKKRGILPAEPVPSLSPVVEEASITEIAEIRGTIVITEPTQEQIANLAYAIWQARGCQDGSPEEDWLAAEQQLRAVK